MNKIVFTKALIVQDRRVLVLKRAATAGSGAGGWDLPGGGLEFGEEPLAGIAREISEETGLIARIDRLLFATSHISGDMHCVGLVYLGNSDSRDVTLSTEHTEFDWITKQRLEEILHTPMWEDYKRNNIHEILEID